jgi:hydrogenase expression/formation protein HypE
LIGKFVMDDGKKILLAHGGGGRLMGNLIEELILPKFGNATLDGLTDCAALNLESGAICFTTDSFVVKPLFFNGGDIGKIAVCGTVNDIAVGGAKPAALSMSLILEEGLEISVLEKILTSAAETAKAAGVDIVTGDTKVVERGAADGIFINTAGVGVRRAEISFGRICPGDKIIINGTIGDHGMTIISQREGIGFDSPLKSDCACLNGLIEKVLDVSDGVKFMRDPTRGGVASTINEIASASRCSVELKETALPVNGTVRAAADMLGFDLLEIANEGKVLFVVGADEAEKVLVTCKGDELGRAAAIIGEVVEADGKPMVEMITRIGGRRVVQTPYGRELPRIC